MDLDGVRSALFADLVDYASHPEEERLGHSLRTKAKVLSYPRQRVKLDGMGAVFVDDVRRMRGRVLTDQFVPAVDLVAQDHSKALFRVGGCLDLVDRLRTTERAQQVFVEPRPRKISAEPLHGKSMADLF